MTPNKTVKEDGLEHIIRDNHCHFCHQTGDSCPGEGVCISAMKKQIRAWAAGEFRKKVPIQMEQQGEGDESKDGINSFRWVNGYNAAICNINESIDDFEKGDL